jgi:hypothetical protein
VTPAQLHTVPTTPPNSATAEGFVFGNTAIQSTPSFSGEFPENDQAVSPYTPQGSGDVVMTTGFVDDEAQSDYLSEDTRNDFDFNPHYGPRINYPPPPQ